LPISILVKQTSVSVGIGNGASLHATAGDLDLLAASQVDSIGSAASKYLSVAYGLAHATSSVDVGPNAKLTADAGSVNVLARGIAVSTMSATTQRYLSDPP